MSRKNSHKAKEQRRAEREAKTRRQAANDTQQEGLRQMTPLAQLISDLDTDKSDLGAKPPRLIHRDSGEPFTEAEAMLLTAASAEELQAALAAVHEWSALKREVADTLRRVVRGEERL